MGTLNDKNDEEQEEEDNLIGKMMKQFSKKHSAEENATEINTMGASSVSPERRKTIHIALNEIVQNRLVKAKSITEAPRQSISL